MGRCAVCFLESMALHLSVGVCWRSQILQPSECPSGGTGCGAVIEVCRAAVASAGLGGVGGPVSGGGSLPADSAPALAAEHPGQHGGGGSVGGGRGGGGEGGGGGRGGWGWGGGGGGGGGGGAIGPGCR